MLTTGFSLSSHHIKLAMILPTLDFPKGHFMKNKSTLFSKSQNIISVLVLQILMFFSFNVMGQVTGTVTDAETGEPLIGANITFTNQETIGTVSDFDGTYAINAQKGDSLSISYTGYATQNILVGDDTVIDITLYSGEFMDEVVVIGYGAVRKEDLTGTVTKVDESQFNRGAITSPESLLTGKVAGLQISSNGEPGGANRIRLRGGTSLGGGGKNDPLIVIDGVPLDIDVGNLQGNRNPLNFVNPSDVASMTVLKDASAAAIYGTRAANGVIIITTKTGQAGKLKVNYSGNANVATLSGSVPVLSPNNFRNAISAKEPGFFDSLGEVNTDWVDEVTDMAWGTEHNISLSGGTKKSRYRISGAYQKTDGVLRTSSNQNTSIAANLSTKLFNDKLSVNFKTKNGFTQDQFAPNVMGAALGFDPTRPVRAEGFEEFGGFWQWSSGGLAPTNPVSIIEQTDNNGSSFRSLNNLTLEYELPFVKGLSITSNTAYDYIKGEKQDLNTPFLRGGSFPIGGTLFLEDIRNYTATIETFGTYKTRLEGMQTDLTVTAGHSWQEFDRENYWEQGNTLELVGDEYVYTNDILADSSLRTSRVASFFARTILSTQDKYLLTLSVRTDGSSRFGPSNRWGLFSAAAFGWRILEEPFAAGLKNTFTNLKLRVGWGITGNQEIGDYLFNTFYDLGAPDVTYQFGDEYVQTLRGTGVDPDIKWETTSSFNIGLDFGFFDNRLSGALEFYQKNTSDLLLRIPVAAFTNLSDRILTNVAELENRGVELELTGIVLDRDEWDVSLGFNAAYNANEITRLDNSIDQGTIIPQGGISGDVGQTIQVLRVGNSIETFYTYRHKIVNGQPLNDTEDHNGDGLIDALDMYEDINGDGLINENDLVTGEAAAPDLTFGLTTNIRYKKFDLAATFRANIGNYVYDNVASSTGFFDRLRGDFAENNNVHESAFENDFFNRQLLSDIYIKNASFLKLDNITLGYNFDANKVFNSLRVFTTIQNVFVLTQYDGIDPELPQFSGGIDNNVYPISRRFILGVNANF